MEGANSIIVELKVVAKASRYYRVVLLSHKQPHGASIFSHLTLCESDVTALEHC